MGLTSVLVLAFALLLALATFARGEQVGVDTWAYIVDPRPGPSCIPNRPQFCTTTYATSNRIVSIRGDGLLDVTVKSASGIDVVFDGYKQAYRAFGTGRDTQPATGPLHLPLTVSAPVLPGVPDIRRVTAGALELYRFASFTTTPVDTSSCALSGATSTITHSAWVYYLRGVNFGGSVGVRDALVLEDVSGYQPGAQDPAAGMRLERYFFALGFGNVRQEGFDDSQCRAGQTCDGYYDASPNGQSVLVNTTYGGRLPKGEFCPALNVPAASTPPPSPTPAPTPTPTQGGTITGTASIAGHTVSGTARDSAKPWKDLWISAWIGDRGGIFLGDIAQTSGGAFSGTLSGVSTGQVVAIYVTAYASPYQATTPVLLGKVVVP